MPTTKIHFFSEGEHPPIRFSKAKFRAVAGKVFADHHKIVGYVNIIFCNDEYLLEINRSYLDHDYYTDIITFDYDDDRVESDIYISTERVLENAGKADDGGTRELYRVMLHGCIHLCGFGDKTEKEVSVMRQKENYYLEMVNSN